MKKFTKVLAAVLASAMVLTVPASAEITATINESANRVEEGLVRSANGYNALYLVKNKRVRNSWKTVREDGKDYKMYFGGDGYALRAKAVQGFHNVAVKQIGGKKYGFDEKGHLVSGDWIRPILSLNQLKDYTVKTTDRSWEEDGYYFKADIYVKYWENQIYSFNKNGVYNVTRTRKLRGLAHQYLDVKPLLNALGKYVKKSNGASLSIYDSWKQQMYYYDHLVVVTNYRKYTKKTVEVIVALIPMPTTGNYPLNWDFSTKFRKATIK
jgi:hypothetical protein